MVRRLADHATSRAKYCEQRDDFAGGVQWSACTVIDYTRTSGPSPAAARKDGVNARNETLKPQHEAAEELRYGVNSDLAIVGDEAGGKLDVRLDRIHLRRITERQNALEVLLPTVVPIFPGEVPIIADGLRANEFSPQGRLAQSIAFFNTPGIERLYSGVTKRTASTAAIASFNARAVRRVVRVVVVRVQR
jgi:hypothetical protein